jgi:mono/diheme cytochrome c family protein
MKPVSRKSPSPVLSLLALALTSCAPAYRGEPVSGSLDVSDPQVALGQQVFNKNCQQCHPKAAAGLAPGISGKPLPGSLIKFQVRRGLGSMPAFSEEQISEKELDAVVAYIQKLREHEAGSADESS